MQIQIRYCLRGEATSQTLNLSPEAYFDPLDEGEQYSVRSAAKFTEEYQYTRHAAEELSWTVLEISDAHAFWKVRTQFLNGLKSIMLHSQESDGSEEIIHQTEIGLNCWHTIRTLKQPNQSWAMLANGLTIERDGKFVEYQDFCGDNSFEQRTAFGEVN